MKPLEDLLPRILPRVPNCAEPLALQAIRTAAMEFCERSRLWRSQDAFTITADDDYAAVCVPYGAVLFEIESARFAGLPLDPVSISWLDGNIVGWRTKTATAAKWLTQTEPDTVRVVPAAEGELDLSLILKPSDEAEYLPDWMIQSHGRTLADGALAEIMMLPGQPFTNPNLSDYHRNRFDQELAKLTGANIKGQQGAPMRTKPHFF